MDSNWGNVAEALVAAVASNGSASIKDLKEGTTANHDGGDETKITKSEEDDKPVVLSEEPGHWNQVMPYDYDGLNTRENTTWDGNARVYEWDGEHGDVGPEYPELERILFGTPEDRESHGVDFTK